MSSIFRRIHSAQGTRVMKLPESKGPTFYANRLVIYSYDFGEGPIYAFESVPEHLRPEFHVVGLVKEEIVDIIRNQIRDDQNRDRITRSIHFLVHIHHTSTYEKTVFNITDIYNYMVNTTHAVGAFRSVEECRDFYDAFIACKVHES